MPKPAAPTLQPPITIIENPPATTVTQALANPQKLVNAAKQK